MDEYCNKCEHAQSRADPDPYDWFCDDDVKWHCQKTNKVIESGCRPYQEVKQPEWCPLLKGKQMTKMEVLDRIQTLFFQELSKKNSWGKNEVQVTYMKCTQKALMEALSNKS